MLQFLVTTASIPRLRFMNRDVKFSLKINVYKCKSSLFCEVFSSEAASKNHFKNVPVVACEWGKSDMRSAVWRSQRIRWKALLMSCCRKCSKDQINAKCYHSGFMSDCYNVCVFTVASDTFPTGLVFPVCWVLGKMGPGFSVPSMLAWLRFCCQSHPCYCSLITYPTCSRFR